jgi:hypothetical protein
MKLCFRRIWWNLWKTHICPEKSLLITDFALIASMWPSVVNDRRCIHPIRFLRAACGIVFHSTRAAPSSWVLFGWTWRAEIRTCSSLHKCSMGLRSRDRASQSKQVIPCLSEYSWRHWLYGGGHYHPSKWTHYQLHLSIQHYLGVQDLISIPLGSQCASVEVNEVSMSIPADSTPDNYWSAAIQVVFRKVCCMEPFP